MKKLFLALCLTLAVAIPGFGQINDSIWDLTPGAIAGTASANFVVCAAASTGTCPTVTGANLAPVQQVASSAAATHTYGWDVSCNSRTAAGKGCTVFGVAFYYGIQTTAATSMGAPACNIITLPVPAAAETASTVAGTNIPLTAQPVVGSANLATTTAGAFFTEYLVFTTPQPLNGPFQKIHCTLTLVQGAAAAMVSNSPGGTVFGVNTIF
jgi:hypothetical protein